MRISLLERIVRRRSASFTFFTVRTVALAIAIVASVVPRHRSRFSNPNPKLNTAAVIKKNQSRNEGNGLAFSSDMNWPSGAPFEVAQETSLVQAKILGLGSSNNTRYNDGPGFKFYQEEISNLRVNDSMARKIN